MRLYIFIALVFMNASHSFASATAQAAPEPARVTPLSLTEVLDSAQTFYPLLQAAQMEAQSRSAANRSAAGAFDTQIALNGEVRPLGFYENRGGAVSLEQPTRFYGVEVFGRYRYGEGDFPSYDGARLTDGTGEVSAGLKVPILRGGRIDKERAAVRRAALDLESMSPELQLQRVSVLRDATVVYWEWVSAGHIVDAMKQLLSVAEARQMQIARRVERGSEAVINLRDNKRLVVERRSRLRAAERDFRRATIALSLFLRDETGNPTVVDVNRLPPSFPEEAEIHDQTVDRDLARAREAHPELRKLAFEREKRLLEIQLARNQVLPDLSFGLEGSRDFGRSRPGIDEVGKGSPDSRSATEVKMNMRLEFPVQMRAARGRLAQAKIRLDQLDRRIQFAREKIEMEARMALESLSAALEQTTLARENVRLAELLRTAEVRKLGAGLSNLIDLNIREVQAAGAAQGLILAQKEYFHALAIYEARIVAFDI